MPQPNEEEPIERVAARYVQNLDSKGRADKAFISSQVLMAQLINRVGVKRAQELIAEAQITWKLLKGE